MGISKFFTGVFALSAMLVACGDDSTSAKDTEIEELSSSSAVEIASTSSSSWQALSSTIRNDNSSSSSVLANSSSSVIANEVTQSFSSEATQSSTSITTATPCNVDGENNCVYGSLTDSRDGQTYKTVTIGTQTWMAENLNYAYTGVPYNNFGYTSDSTSWCYNDDSSNCAKYGRLYTWAAAMDSVGTWTTNGKGCGYGSKCSPTGIIRGICPEGWHLPDTTEWNTLFSAVGGEYIVGRVLKSQTVWTAYDGITNEDSFGFSALPSGYRNYDGYYDYEGNYAYFWSSTEYGSNLAYVMSLYYLDDYAHLSNRNKDFGRSVRCLKD